MLTKYFIFANEHFAAAIVIENYIALSNVENPLCQNIENFIHRWITSGLVIHLCCRGCLECD